MTIKTSDAHYDDTHHWLREKYGIATKCENVECFYPRFSPNKKNRMYTPKRFEWANISGEYRKDRNDFIQLCPSCHILWDRGKIKINNIHR